MSTAYTIKDKERMYFLTTTIVGWLDVFSRKVYRDVILDSFRYCARYKKLHLHSYVIMSNHIHWIASAGEGGDLSAITRDFKRHTSVTIVEEIKNSNTESRKEWMLNMFRFAGAGNKHNKEYQFWQNDNHPEVIFSDDFLKSKLNYIHNNPVRAGLVEKPEDYLYSSARNYIGMEGLIDIDILILHE
jgi:putative transposase